MEKPPLCFLFFYCSRETGKAQLHLWWIRWRRLINVCAFSTNSIEFSRAKQHASCVLWDAEFGQYETKIRMTSTSNLRNKNCSILIPPDFSRLGQVWVRRKSHKILHLEKFWKHRKIRMKSKDFSRIWSECRDSNPRPLGPEGWSDIFRGHFRSFPHLSARKISQRRPFLHE